MGIFLMAAVAVPLIGCQRTPPPAKKPAPPPKSAPWARHRIVDAHAHVGSFRGFVLDSSGSSSTRT